MKRLALLIASVALIACSSSVQPTSQDKSDLLDNLIYIKDTSTGLCFATVTFVTYGFNKGTSITNVPCDSVPSLRRKK